MLLGGAHYVQPSARLSRRPSAAGANRASCSTRPTIRRPKPAVERLLSVARFDPVKVGGLTDAVRLELPGGDLNQYGSAFNGRVQSAANGPAAVGVAA